MFDIAEELKKIPDKPGCYIMKDNNDEIIYIGKAKVLKNRVRQYFQNSANHTPKVVAMVTHIKAFEYIVTDSELEALILECNLIKQHRPKYNILLKDDKMYPYIKITLNERYPRLFSTRMVKKDKAKYFGPFTDTSAVNATLGVIQENWKIRKCTRNLPKDIGKSRPCLNYDIGKCGAPCNSKISEEDYNHSIDEIIDLLDGKASALINRLKAEMQQESDEMNFEKAAALRDKVNGIEQIILKQKMSRQAAADQDIIALARANDEALAQIFFIRDGKLIGREHFMMTGVTDMTNEIVMSEFIKQFYSGTPLIPKEVILQTEPTDMDVCVEWLSSLRGNKVHVQVPQRGEKEKLVELASKNAILTLEHFGEQIKKEKKRTEGAVEELREALGLDDEIERIEAYDISNTQGFESVGSMVVFENGKPKRSDYRKFKIKTVTGANDFKSMEEVLMRRFTHGLKEKEEEIADGKFVRFPELILVDGGKIQVGAAENVLKELNLSIPVCGMVKDNRHRTDALFYKDKEVRLSHHSECFKFVTRIQDEVHRFAIEYHRVLRGKKATASILDEIAGIGKVRRKELLRHFGSIENIKNAEKGELQKVGGMNSKSAEEVYNFFRK